MSRSSVARFRSLVCSAFSARWLSSGCLWVMARCCASGCSDLVASLSISGLLEYQGSLLLIGLRQLLWPRLRLLVLLSELGSLDRHGMLGYFGSAIAYWVP